MTSTLPRTTTRRANTLVNIARPSINGYPRLRLTLGPALWRAIGRPSRVHIQRLDGQLLIEGTQTNAGFPIVAEQGLPRVWCDAARNLLTALPEGDYPVAIHSSILVITIPDQAPPLNKAV